MDTCDNEGVTPRIHANRSVSTMPRSDLPFGSEFSPSQIDLAEVLEMANTHGGDWNAFEIAIQRRYFDSHTSTNDYNRRKLANNTKLGMIAYGLVNRNANLTDFGRKLYGVRDNSAKFYSTLGRHILLELNGAGFVQCILDMQTAGEAVELVSLRHRLDDLGIHVPRGGKHMSTMRLWLEKAGVFVGSKWRVDTVRFHKLMGTTPQEIDALLMMLPEQRAYIRTLANIGDKKQHPSNEIEKLASVTYGIRFNEKNLPKTVLYPLRDAGYIDLERGTAESGRGAKPFMVSVTAKFKKEIHLPLLEQAEQLTGADLRPLLRKSLAEILEELDSDNRYIAGLALEALAFKLMRLVDLDYVATRLRGQETGGAEVDLIFESSRLVFSRWQIQCKNTKHVSLDDVAKEVGLTHMLKSNVIVMVSTGEVGAEARRYANKIMTDSNLCIVIVNRADIKLIKETPTAIIDVFAREAQHAMNIKQLKI